MKNNYYVDKMVLDLDNFDGFGIFDQNNSCKLKYTNKIFAEIKCFAYNILERF